MTVRVKDAMDFGDLVDGHDPRFLTDRIMRFCSKGEHHLCKVIVDEKYHGWGTCKTCNENIAHGSHAAFCQRCNEAETWDEWGFQGQEWYCHRCMYRLPEDDSRRQSSSFMLSETTQESQRKSKRARKGRH